MSSRRQPAGSRREPGGRGTGPGRRRLPEAGEDRGVSAARDISSAYRGIAAQASICLGIVENPVTGKRETDIEAARHVIDMLEMLKAKTKGNLDES